jgi:hypothetical protein
MNMPASQNTQPDPATPPKEEGSGFLFNLVLGTVAALVLLVLPFWCLLDYLGEQRINHVEPAGELVAVLPVGSWNPDSMIETTTGFYTVDGSVALVRGIQFRLETRDNGARFLCNANGKYCGHVVGQGLEEVPPEVSPTPATQATPNPGST